MELTIKSGPTFHNGWNGWFITIDLEVNNEALAFYAYMALPEPIEFEGRIYHRTSFSLTDFTASYFSPA
jgi:hypothetical protein